MVLRRIASAVIAMLVAARSWRYRFADDPAVRGSLAFSAAARFAPSLHHMS